MWVTLGVMLLTSLVIPLIQRWAKKRRESGKPLFPRLRRRRGR